MTTFADLIATSTIHPPSHVTSAQRDQTQELIDLLSPKEAVAATRFVIDEIARYSWEEGEYAESHDKESYPCLVPPFPLMWMEYDKQPAFKTPDGEVVGTADWKIARYGVRIERYSVGDEPEHFDMVRDDMKKDDGIDISKAKWAVAMSMYVQEHGKICGPVVTEYLYLDELGRSLRKRSIYVSLSAKKSLLDDPSSDQGGAAYQYAFIPFRKALTFLNTRGIKHDEHKPSTKANKNWQRKTGQPLLTHKTLVVQSVLAGGGTRSSEPGEKSHHIRRGHFKDYRDGAGLFGKYKVLVWVENHVAGDRSVGEVAKNYEVRPPREKK